jgi:predicted anti-sigma-YlaC factor YlaD
MDCREAQEQILESLTEPRLGRNSAELDHHLAECENCRRFFETQRHLDLQLSVAISAPPLNPQFRKSVMEKARREPYSIWHEFLPDKAHLAGCACATALSIWILPFSPGSIFLAGSVFTLATYFIQSALRGALETREEGKQ